jgi:hypothetical protein
MALNGNKTTGETERKIKALLKRYGVVQKEVERRKRMLEREENEREVQLKTQLVLIYPLITYKEEFYI